MSRKFNAHAIFILFLVFESCLFFYIAFNQIATFPPDLHDQTTFLDKAYALRTIIVEQGVLSVFSSSLNRIAGGLLLPYEGAFVGSLFGVSRVAMLSVNLFWFLLVLTLLFSTVKKITSSYTGAFLTLGLALSCRTPFNYIAGLFDFRIDFSAACLFGAWVMSLINSDFGLNRKWSLIAILAGVLLILQRYLGLVYVVGVGLGLLVLLLIEDFSKSKFKSERFLKSGLILLGTILICAPVIWLNFDVVIGYYSNHFVGAEPGIRAHAAGVSTWFQRLTYYPGVLLYDHLGIKFCALLACLILSAGFLIIKYGRQPMDKAKRFLCLFLLGAVVGPILALSMDPASAAHTAGIVFIPFVVLAGVLTTNAVSRAPKIIFKTLAFGVLLFGLIYQSSRAVLGIDPLLKDKVTMAEWVNVSQFMTKWAIDKGLSEPKLSYNLISAKINEGSVQIFGYEQQGQKILWKSQLGSTIFEISLKESIAALDQSDLILFFDQIGEPPYPFHQSMREQQADLQKWLAANRIEVKSLPFQGNTIRFYSKSL